MSALLHKCECGRHFYLTIKGTYTCPGCGEKYWSNGMKLTYHKIDIAVDADMGRIEMEARNYAQEA